ncbi:MAG: alpha/beta hydrolase [Actinomycetota bacterium]|nr:alpha/beta hydrolase [Actinomycetota bacterium]
MSERNEHQAVRLRDGRLLGFADYGDPDGAPLLFFHGEVGSRLLGRALDSAARDRALRIVSPDRPGLGLSDFRPGRTIAEWPADVVELTGQLGIGRFGVVGVSAGAPYALACGWMVPERLTAVVVVSPALPPSMRERRPDTPRLERLLTRSATQAPWTIRPVMTLLGNASRRSPEQAVDRMAASAGEADHAVFSRPEVRSMLTRSMTETFRSGSRGVAHDLRLLASNWGIPFDGVPTEVAVVRGEADAELTAPGAQRLVDALPHAYLRTVPGAGHHVALAEPGQVLDAVARPRVQAE